MYYMFLVLSSHQVLLGTSLGEKEFPGQFWGQKQKTRQKQRHSGKETNIDNLRDYKQDKDYKLTEYLYEVQWEDCQEDLIWEGGASSIGWGSIG